MLKSLFDFPNAFYPLIVVIGDRREPRPKTEGDLLVYSVSSVDIMYINYLKLPDDILILSDKIFVLEDHGYLKEKFGRVNILTIGSPAVNLFSRQINNKSFFRLFISNEAIDDMKKQEDILSTIKTDKLGLLIYQQILNGVKSAEQIAKTFKIPDTGAVEAKFERLIRAYEKTGLKNYKDLMHKFEGQYIIDPVNNHILDLEDQIKRGTFIQDNNDFGFVSLAPNPFASSDNFWCIYVAGRHGPGTAHGLRLLSKKEYWENRPLGGVYEIQMNTVKAFSQKFENVIDVLETDEYEISIKIKKQYEHPIKKKPKISCFISTSYMPNDKYQIDKVESISRFFEIYFQNKGYDAKCYHPYNITQDQWSFARRIYGLFPQMDFIIHDITSYRLGVISEIGGSLGLNKKIFLLWDKREPFDVNLLPKIIEHTNVIDIDFTRPRNIQSVLERKVFSVIESAKPHYQCPGSDKVGRSKCEFHSGKKVTNIPKEIFIFANRSLENLRKKIVEKVQNREFAPKFYDDFPGESMICKICQAISKCKYSIVDITKEDLDGIIVLGIVMARKNKAILIRKIGTTREISMWDKPTLNWHDDTIDNDVNKALDILLNQ